MTRSNRTGEQAKGGHGTRREGIGEQGTGYTRICNVGSVNRRIGNMLPSNTRTGAHRTGGQGAGGQGKRLSETGG